MHELYVHPFLLIVMAGVVSVMCSYSKRETLTLVICEADANTDLVNRTIPVETTSCWTTFLSTNLAFKVLSNPTGLRQRTRFLSSKG